MEKVRHWLWIPQQSNPGCYIPAAAMTTDALSLALKALELQIPLGLAYFAYEYIHTKLSAPRATARLDFFHNRAG